MKWLTLVMDHNLSGPGLLILTSLNQWWVGKTALKKKKSNENKTKQKPDL